MKKFYVSFLLVILCVSAYPQKVYFVDGYHGGIYGHYPVEWKTRFIIDQLAAHPEWKICLEIEPETWDSVKIRTPKDYEAFRKMSADRRIEFTNPAYAQPYCYNISGESIIRNFEYGIKTINRHFPDVEFITYSVEEPCFTSALPQILKSFGFKYAVLKCPNTCWGGYMKAHGGEMVNWIGPDGSSMLTVPRHECEQLEKNSTWQTTAWSNSTEYLDACLKAGFKNPVGMCFQDAGWKYGPWIGAGDTIKNNSIYVTWREYFESISAGKTDENYNLSQDDVLVNLMWGSQVLQQLAQRVRVSENRIVMAEKAGVIANVSNGYTYNKEDIQEAWRTLMLSQHHDSWIVPYNRLNKYRTWAEEIKVWTDQTNAISDQTISSALGSFEKERASNVDGYVRVYNTVGQKRNEITKLMLGDNFTKADNVALYDADGKLVPSHTETDGDGVVLVFRAEVPSFGYATYRVERSTQPVKAISGVSFLENGDCVMETDMYRIVVDASKGGVIKSLVAKAEGNKEFIDPDQKYAFGELRGFFYEQGKFYSSRETPARITVLKDNGLECSIMISGEIATHPFVQKISLSQGERRIDFDLNVAWKNSVGIGEYKQLGKDSQGNRRAFCDDRYKLNVLFPVALNAPALSKDAPFDVCLSQQEDTHFKTWDSIKHNVILHWVDIAEQGKGHGLALLSDHTTSYSYGSDFPLGLTAQYSGLGLWGRDYKIEAPLNMKFAVVPHSGDWARAAIQSESNNWSEPLICSYQSHLKLENKSLIDLSNTGYELTSAQITDKGVLVRLFNAEGSADKQSVKFMFPLSCVSEVDLAGGVIKSEKVKQSGSKSEVKVSMPRFGLRTYLIN